jgi:hypothetical protein
MFNWSGNKGSFKGDIPFYGKSGLDFYTARKVCLGDENCEPRVLSSHVDARSTADAADAVGNRVSGVSSLLVSLRPVKLDFFTVLTRHQASVHMPQIH